MIPLILLVCAVLAALSGAEPWMAAPVTTGLLLAAATILLRQRGLSWGSLLGGFRRDH